MLLFCSQCFLEIPALNPGIPCHLKLLLLHLVQQHRLSLKWEVTILKWKKNVYFDDFNFSWKWSEKKVVVFRCGWKKTIMGFQLYPYFLRCFTQQWGWRRLMGHKVRLCFLKHSCLFVCNREIPITVSRRAPDKEARPSPYQYCF